MYISFNKWFNKSVIHSDHSSLTIILFICLIYRVYYFMFFRSGVIDYSSDSVTYFASINIFKGAINLYRTPVYPYIIEFFGYLSKENLIRNLIIFQQIISFIAIIPFYSIVKNILQNKFLIILATCFYGCWNFLLNQNTYINPECLCIAGSTCMLFLILNYIQKPTKIAAALAGVFPFFLVMLKPTYLILLVIIFLFLIGRFLLFKTEKIKLFWGIMGFLLASTGIWGYCQMNKVYNGEFTLSKISLNNSLANIISSRAYKLGGDQELINLIDTTRNKGIYTSVFYINNECIDNYEECIKRFPKTLKPTGDMAFSSGFPDISNYSSKRVNAYVKRAKDSKIYFKYLLKRIINTIRDHLKLFFLMIIEAVFIFYAFFKTRKLCWIPLFCILFIAGQFATLTIAVGQFSDNGIEQIEDIYRLLIPSYPFIIALTASFLSILISVLNKKEFIKSITNIA